MNTESKKVGARRAWLLALLTALACSSDTHVGCSPTLTCSLRPSRFAPPVTRDAGPSDCDATDRRCSAGDLSLGAQHACAVTDGSNLICWGDDSEGQRGKNLETVGALPDAGSYRNRFSHVLDRAQQVSAGAQHTCALQYTGSVNCFGLNADGQVTGELDPRAVEPPVRVHPLGEVLQLAAGAKHTCGRTADGVYCWGSNQYGQSGRALSDANPGPLLVPNTELVEEIACGVRHCCFRRAGKVACWGELIDAQGAPYVSTQPVPVEGLEGVLQIAAGAGHSCALQADGVMCWGLNDDGQLGDSSTLSSASPVRVRGIPVVVGYVAAGGGEMEGQLAGHSCAVDGVGQVWCWGRNAEGQLGRVVSADHLKPEVVQEYGATRDDLLDNISRVALGGTFSCALGSSGAVWCWGDDSFGQLGTEEEPEHERRTPVAGEALRVRRFGRMR